MHQPLRNASDPSQPEGTTWKQHSVEEVATQPTAHVPERIASEAISEITADASARTDLPLQTATSSGQADGMSLEPNSGLTSVPENEPFLAEVHEAAAPELDSADNRPNGMYVESQSVPANRTSLAEISQPSLAQDESATTDAMCTPESAQPLNQIANPGEFP